MAEQGFTVKLSARVDGYLAAMEAAKRATKEVGDSGVNLDRLGGKMHDVGMTMSKSVTLPLVAAGGLAIKMSADFEGAFARMEGLAGVQADEVDGLKKSVLDLAGETAQAPQKLADALYEASSAGLDTAGAMKAVEMAAKGAAVGMGSAQDIVGLVASATASYGKENITAAQATDILTASIKAGRADPAELAGSLGRILPIAAQLGISFDQVGGATAFLSNIMGNTAETVTALQGFFVQLLSPTKQGQQALKDMGTSVADLHAAIDKDGLMGALDLLRSKGFAANQDALRNLFPDVQAFQGALALINDTSGALTTTLDATKNSTGALDTAFGLAADTSGFKMKKAWADIQVALIQAGDIIMPIVSGVAGAISGLAEIFSGLPGPVQAIVVGFLGLVAAAGPVLMIAGSMIKNFTLVKTTMAAMSLSTTTAITALGAVAAVMVAAGLVYSQVTATKQRLTDATNLFIQALDDEAHGQEHAMDAAIAAQVGTVKMTADAKALGLSLGQMASIARGEVVPEWEEMRRQGDKSIDTFLEAHDGSLDLYNAYLRLKSGIGTAVQGYKDAQSTYAAQIAIERELQAVTSETDRETRRLNYTFVEGVDAFDESAAAAERTAYAVDRFAEVVAEADLAYRRLTGKLDEEEAWDNVNAKIAEFGKDTEVTAADVRGITRDIADYVTHTNTIPAEKKTEILAALRDGDIAKAEWQLAALARTREIYLKLTGPGAVTAAGYGPLNGHLAAGGPATAGRRYLVGENGPEILEMPGSTSGWVHPNTEWMSDQRIGGPVSAASQGLYGSSGTTSAGPVVNNNTVQFNGGINNTIDMQSAWQQANFALASAA